MQHHILSWQGHEGGAVIKESSWYWAVGIIGGGIAIASIIGGNYLFALIALIGAFAIMLAGSRPGILRSYALSEKGVHIGRDVIAFENIKQFAIRDEEPKRLMIETNGLAGIVGIPLTGVDFRSVRSILKNHSVEETDTLESFIENITSLLGM